MVETTPNRTSLDQTVLITLTGLPQGRPVRIDEIAYAAAYCRRSVESALQRLEQSGLIRRNRPKCGLPYSYEVHHHAISDS